MSRGQKEIATRATANSLPTLLVKTAATGTGQENCRVYGHGQHGDGPVDKVVSQIVSRSLFGLLHGAHFLNLVVQLAYGLCMVNGKSGQQQGQISAYLVLYRTSALKTLHTLLAKKAPAATATTRV